MEPTETGKSSSETCMFFCWGAFFGCCPAAFSSEFLGRTLVDLLGLALDPFPTSKETAKKLAKASNCDDYGDEFTSLPLPSP